MSKINISEKVLKYLIIIFICLTMCLSGLVVGYGIFRPSETAEMSDENNESVSVSANDMKPLNKNIKDSKAKIDSSTKMVYEYYYTLDSITEVIEESAPYFLINMDNEKIVKIFPDWEIITFSKDEVVMRKNVEDKSSQHYIVGIQNGFVAIFYETPINGTNLKELTNTPIETLPKDEQIKLTKGIPVHGDEELLRVMEDYES